MKIEIPLEVINATKQCTKNFACLSQPVETLCKVENLGGSVHFIRCKSTTSCGYQTPFGFGHFCNCPTRLAIYKSYQI